MKVGWSGGIVRINKAYNRRTRSYSDKANHCHYPWFKASVEAGLCPDTFSLRRCWVNTVNALLKRGLVEYGRYEVTDPSSTTSSSVGLRLTEAGKKALEN